MLHTISILDIEELGHRFVRNVTQHSSRAPAPAPAPASAPAPGLVTSAAILPRVSSAIKEYSIDAWSDWLQLDMEVVHMGHREGVQPVTHHIALQQELVNYRGQNVEAEMCGFLLPCF